MEPPDLTDLRESVEPMVEQEPPVNEERSEIRETKDSQDKTVILVLRDPLEILVQMDQLVKQVRLDQEVILDKSETKETWDHLEILDHLEELEQLDLLDL